MLSGLIRSNNVFNVPRILGFNLWQPFDFLDHELKSATELVEIIIFFPLFLSCPDFY